MDQFLTGVGFGIAGMACGAMGAWLLVVSQRRIRELESQLFSAWKDGYAIPPKLSEVPKPVAMEPLPQKLQMIVDEWESPETKLRLTEEFSRALQDGFGERAVIERYLQGNYGDPHTP